MLCNLLPLSTFSITSQLLWMKLTERRFDIDFVSDVVQADVTVRNLAWRICNAKNKVLVGGNTPELW